MTLPGKLKEDPQYGVGTFEAVSTFDGLIGLRFAYGTTFAFTLPNLDKALEQLNRGQAFGVPSAPRGPVNIFAPEGVKMLEQIGQGLTHTQAAKADQYMHDAWALDGIGESIERIASDLLDTRKDSVRRTAPAHVRRVVQPTIKAQLRPYAKRVAHAEARARKAEDHAAALEQRLAHLERKVAKPHSIAVPGVIPRVGGIEREQDRERGRIGKIEKLLGLAALAGIVAKVLEKMGAGFIRCSNVKRYGRHLCGMDRGLLDTLIADSLVIVGTISLVDFARGMEGIMGEVEPVVTKFWRAT